jgi:hypothetical protein
MDLIVVTGIFTGGIIPLFAAIGKGINLIVSMFNPSVYWSYWDCVCIGLNCVFVSSWITYLIKRKKNEE